jgi:hypothetical protein
MKLFTKMTFILCLTIFLAGCKKEFDAIGLNLRNDYLSPADCDTSTIEAYSMPADSINTTNLNNVVVGEIIDPVFGRLNTGVYVKYLLSQTSVNFGENPVFDSLVLTIQYTGYYGDTLSDMNLKVYEITDELLTNETAYFSNQKIEYNSTNQLYNPTSTFRPKPNTTISYATDSIKYPAHLHIRLSDELGRRLMDKSVLESDATLHQIFKGFYITATTNSRQGCLLYFNLRSSISVINLYYHNGQDVTKQNNRRYTFKTPSSSTYYTTATFDHSMSTDDHFKRQVLQGEKELGKQSLYVQSLGGVKTFIHFPHLPTAYKDKTQIINKAELVVPAIYDNGSLLPPSALTLQMIGKNGEIGFLPDNLIGTAYFGGVYDEKEQCYRFRITKYVQQLIQQSIPNNGLYLVVSGAGVRGNRLVVTDVTSNKYLRLDLYYTNY